MFVVSASSREEPRGACSKQLWQVCVFWGGRQKALGEEKQKEASILLLIMTPICNYFSRSLFAFSRSKQTGFECSFKRPVLLRGAASSSVLFPAGNPHVLGGNTSSVLPRIHFHGCLGTNEESSVGRHLASSHPSVLRTSPGSPTAAPGRVCRRLWSLPLSW